MYARRFWPRTPVSEIRERWDGLEAGEAAEDSGCRVAGRIMSRREHGKAAFFTIRDGWDDIQLFANVNALGQESFRALTHLDIGDIGSLRPVFKTRRGELSVAVETWELLTKSLRPPPEKWHGL